MGTVGGDRVDIHRFADALAAQIEHEHPLSTLKDEKEFERQHVMEPTWALALKHPEIRVFVHPWARSDRCKPTCEVGWADPSLRSQGCPRCWEKSKEWSMVEAFGTQNNFDLVGRDQNQHSLAVEIKWLTLASKGPNSEFQRFLGQCTLAAAVHHVVLAVCAFRGQRNKQLDRDDERVRDTLQKIGVRLAVLHAAGG
jgi:hypothetical protein